MEAAGSAYPLDPACGATAGRALPYPSRAALRPGADRRVDDAHFVRYDPEPGKRTGAVIIVIPGGNFDYVDVCSGEGQPIAHWLTHRGITAVVLHYRLISAGHHWPAQYEDWIACAQQVRDNAASWGCDSSRVGVIGFSAGGHLAGYASLCAPAELRPKLQILVYPAVDTTSPHSGAMDPWYACEGYPGVETSFLKLLEGDAPAAFLVGIEADEYCPAAENTDLYAEALRERGVECLYARRKHAFHGCCLREWWTVPCQRWLQGRGWACEPELPPVAPGLGIVRAWYGAADKPWSESDGMHCETGLEEFLQVHGGVAAENWLLGYDPAPGTEKALLVEVAPPQTKAKLITLEEKQDMYLSSTGRDLVGPRDPDDDEDDDGSDDSSDALVKENEQPAMQVLHFALRPDACALLDRSLFVCYIPERRTGAIIIVLPGGTLEDPWSLGTYGSAKMPIEEGHSVGQWLAQSGVTAVVLRYRCVWRGHYWPAPFEDWQECARQVRASAPLWGCDPQRVGVMGFAAGGHLAGYAATSGDLELRPKLQVLVYPAMDTVRRGFHHRPQEHESQDRPDASHALHRRVDADTPPAFLVSLTSDRMRPQAQQHALFSDALQQAGVECVRHAGPGPQGCGLRKWWALRCQGWLHERFGWAWPPDDCEAEQEEEDSGEEGESGEEGDDEEGSSDEEEPEGEDEVDDSHGSTRGMHTDRPPPQPSHFALRPDQDARLDDAMFIVYFPEPCRRTGAVIIVLPRGSYDKCETIHADARTTALWLAACGVTAVLLKYRCVSDGHYWPKQLDDWRDCAGQVASRCEGWGCDAERIGVLGSGAGGHLAGYAALRTRGELMPKLQILVCPAVSTELPGWAASLGYPGHSCSLPALVDSAAPPAFVAGLTSDDDDDECAAAEHTDAYDAALREHGVPCLYVRQPGSYGCGLRSWWTKPCEAWLESMGWAVPIAESPS